VTLAFFDKMKTIIYIDGFNFYYRAVKNTPFKWLDFKSLFQKLLSRQNKIISIKYFTALVSGKYDHYKPIRQETYLRALKAYIPEIEIFYGHFLTHEISAPLVKPIKKQKYVKIIKTEEKGSDVNLAVQLLNDAWLNYFNCAVIVSNDSDLAEALHLVKKYHPGKIIGLMMPGEGHPSKELMKYSDFVKRIRSGVLRSSLLPDPIPGTNLFKPKSW